MKSYWQILRQPQISLLLLIGMIARLPHSALSMLLLLHLVLPLHLLALLLDLLALDGLLLALLVGHLPLALLLLRLTLPLHLLALLVGLLPLRLHQAALLELLPLLVLQLALLLHLLALDGLLLLALHVLRLALRVRHLREPLCLIGPRGLATAIAAPAVATGRRPAHGVLVGAR